MVHSLDKRGTSNALKQTPERQDVFTAWLAIFNRGCQRASVDARQSLALSRGLLTFDCTAGTVYTEGTRRLTGSNERTPCSPPALLTYFWP